MHKIRLRYVRAYITKHVIKSIKSLWTMIWIWPFSPCKRVGYVLTLSLWILISWKNLFSKSCIWNSWSRLSASLNCQYIKKKVAPDANAEKKAPTGENTFSRLSISPNNPANGQQDHLYAVPPRSQRIRTIAMQIQKSSAWEFFSLLDSKLKECYFKLEEKTQKG